MWRVEMKVWVEIEGREEVQALRLRAPLRIAAPTQRQGPDKFLPRRRNISIEKEFSYYIFGTVDVSEGIAWNCGYPNSLDPGFIQEFICPFCQACGKP